MSNRGGGFRKVLSRAEAEHRVAAQAEAIKNQVALEQIVTTVSAHTFAHLAAMAIDRFDNLPESEKQGATQIPERDLLDLANQSKRAAMYYAQGMGLGSVKKKQQ